MLRGMGSKNQRAVADALVAYRDGNKTKAINLVRTTFQSPTVADGYIEEFLQTRLPHVAPVVVR